LIKKRVSRFGEHPFNLQDKNGIVRHRRMAVHSEYFVVYRLRECSSEEEVPMMSIQDLMYGTVKCSGKFDYLLWKSQLLPYYSYICTCDIQEQKSLVVKRKRSMKDEVTLYFSSLVADPQEPVADSSSRAPSLPLLQFTPSSSPFS
jgi:hypothetical protein